MLTLDLIAFHKEGITSSEIDTDIPAGISLYDSGNNSANLLFEFLDHRKLLNLLDLLDYSLFCGFYCYTAEVH